MSTAQSQDTTANPAPLGLLGFGLTTVLLNLHNAGFFPMDAMILGMGIFYGGIAQVIAGIMEWKKGNTFGTTAFTSYGFFWLSLVALLILPKMGLTVAPSSISMSAYLMMWGMLTLFLLINTFKLNKALQIVFSFLTALFFLLSFAELYASPMVKYVAGYVGILTGLSAIYTAIAQITNEVYKKTILPLGLVTK
ncbi:acetate uptake transporter [Patescibacteria group bacterium]